MSSSSGNFSNSALATAAHRPPGLAAKNDQAMNQASETNEGSAKVNQGHLVEVTEEQRNAVKIARARLSGPSQITKDATVADLTPGGGMVILEQGTNDWTCFPGDENHIGNVPMACDPMGLQWALDLLAGKPAPTNKAPGLIYMLCGATQHCIRNPLDTTSPAVPIGPHYMIIWPFDSALHGIPTNVRDAGAWVMYDKTPWAHLHVCGNPWDGTVYHSEKAPNPVWTMKYAISNEDSEQTGFGT